MDEDATMQVRFWGVRGSIATPGADTVRYGGNTACVEVRAGARLIVLDGGTGIRLLGEALAASGRPVDADIFLSHFHWDHIQGIPYFRPGFTPGNRLRFYSHLSDERRLRDVLEGQMNNPNFPVPLSRLSARLEFFEFAQRASLDLGDGLSVRTAPLRHPGGANSVRIEYGGRSVIYASDTEHPAEGLDEELLHLARGADLLIYDAQYTEAEYAGERRGWGHSTPTAGLALAQAAGVKQLALFHHDPARTDDMLDACGADMARRVAQSALTVHVAREGLCIEL